MHYKKYSNKRRPYSKNAGYNSASSGNKTNYIEHAKSSLADFMPELPDGIYGDNGNYSGDEVSTVEDSKFFNALNIVSEENPNTHQDYENNGNQCIKYANDESVDNVQRNGDSLENTDPWDKPSCNYRADNEPYSNQSYDEHDDSYDIPADELDAAWEEYRRTKPIDDALNADNIDTENTFTNTPYESSVFKPSSSDNSKALDENYDINADDLIHAHNYNYEIQRHDNGYMVDSENTVPDKKILNADNPEKTYKRNTYVVVSTVAYLTGVRKQFFDNPECAPDLDIYNELNRDKRARIVRNLCILRNSIERSFSYIRKIMKEELRNLNSMPEYIPQDSITELWVDGINIVRGHRDLNQYLIEINKLISDRINNCKDLFPLWLNWQYIRNLFIMPDGFTVSGLKKAADIFIQNKRMYPYGVYINWHPMEVGNLFANDRKFTTLLYRWNGDSFKSESKVSDTGSSIKRDIYDFLDASRRTILLVDCENSDPYKLCSTLRGLDHESVRKIIKIILIDDAHTSPAWSLLESYTDIPIEHVVVQRILDSKSQVDGTLQRQVIRAYYRDNADSFILVASDSDYWSMIDDIKRNEGARFLVMCERSKFSNELKKKLDDWEIFYCYIDDFYSGDNHDIMLNALIKQVRRYLDSAVRLNVNDMMADAYRVTRVPMTEAERKQFYEKYIRNMSLKIESDGNVTIQLNK